MKYEGEFKNNKIEGKGIWDWPNGDKYEGNFIDGKYNGFGILVYKDGKKYEGEFKDMNLMELEKKLILMVRDMKDVFPKVNIMVKEFGII